MPGEDPYLSARYAVNFVRGLQGGPLYPHYLKVMATLKHFSSYSVENWRGHDRHSFNAVVPVQVTPSKSGLTKPYRSPLLTLAIPI